MLVCCTQIARSLMISQQILYRNNHYCCDNFHLQVEALEFDVSLLYSNCAQFNDITADIVSE